MYNAHFNRAPSANGGANVCVFCVHKSAFVDATRSQQIDRAAVSTVVVAAVRFRNCVCVCVKMVLAACTYVLYSMFGVRGENDSEVIARARTYKMLPNHEQNER